MAQTVLFEIRDRIAYITLNRPESLNAQNVEMRRLLHETLEAVNADPAILVGIISGAGSRAFSTGVDIKEVAVAGLSDEEKIGDGALPYVSKPMIAAIHGYCLAAGFELALGCDIRIATPDAQFGLPEPRWSLPGGYGLHHLSRMIPLGEALHMQLTGERITAQRAYEIGLVQRLVAPDQLMSEAARIADAIVQNAPIAVQAIKQIVMTCRSLPPEEAVQTAAPIKAKIYASEDFAEGPRAFAEKRRPEWKGR